MSEATVSDYVRSMRAALQMIDLQLDRSKLSAAGIADLKAEVDNMRLRIWAIMASEQSKDGPLSLERFRLRRAIEIIGKVALDLEAGQMSAEHPELVRLRDLAHRLQEAIGAVEAR